MTHERLVVPITALGPDDELYAVAFAVPGDAEGAVHVNDSACINAEFEAMDHEDIGNATFGMHQSTHILFDHIFVPWDRVFLAVNGSHAATLSTVSPIFSVWPLPPAGADT
ncbi:MAG: hypothetical protein KBG01_07135 [Syntrophobacterales bacterium]|nr:hypothetical protein [Syntrophobacterales bacterium]